MKRFYVLVICSVFSIIILFPGNYATCQLYSSVNYTEGDSPPVPELYADARNTGNVITNFVGVTVVGNILYIPMTKTFMPPDLTIPSSDSSYQPPDSQNVLRVIDFSNPMEPMVINDIDMDSDLDLWGGPEHHMVISGEFLYLLSNEMETNFESPDYLSIFTEEVTFSIYTIQENKELIITKSISLRDILDSVKADENETFFPQLLKVTENRAYIIFFGMSYPEPSENEYTENNTYEKNTVIVTFDITKPDEAAVLGAARLQITGVPADVDLLVTDTIGYLLVPFMDSSDSNGYIYNSNISVLDLSSPPDISEITSLSAYGSGGQLAKEGDTLYMASKGFGLQLFDISTPTAPQFISLLETPYPLTDSYGGGLQVENKIIIANNGYVYMPDKKNGLLVIDVSDSSNPIIVSSYRSEYISSETPWYSYYPFPFVAICGDYLFLPEVGKGDSGRSLNIISIVDPLNPVSIGIVGERPPEMLTIALRIDVAELLDIHIEHSVEGDIALFGIPSLDALNRKYGVYKIEYPNTGNLSYYVPYYASPPPLSTDEYDYSIEDIRKDRDLRTFYLTFPGSVSLNEIVADYQANPYVITAEISTLNIYEYPGPYGAPYYPVPDYGMSLYGGLYGGYGGLYGGMYGSLYGGIYGGSLYGGLYGGYGGLYGGLYSSGGMYGSLYGGMYGGTGMSADIVPLYPGPTLYSGAYPGPSTVFYGGYGLSEIYGGLMPPIAAFTSTAEPIIQIGTITIEGGVHIGELYIGSQPSTTPELSLAIIPAIGSLMDSPNYSPDDTTSSQESELSGRSDSLNDFSHRQADINWGNLTTWMGSQKKSSSLWWNDLLKSYSSPVIQELWLW